MSTTVASIGAPRVAAERRQKIHPVDEVLPVAKLAAYGFQHVLAFYAGAVLVPIIVAGALKLEPDHLIHLINADLFTCGIASLLQSVGFWNIGVRLPLLQGVTFTAVSPMIAIGLAAGGGTAGLLSIYGSVLCAGLFTFLVAGLFRQAGEIFSAGGDRNGHPDHRRGPAAGRGERHRHGQQPRRDPAAGCSE